MYMFGESIKEFKKKDFSYRKNTSERLINKYPDRCPILLDKMNGSIGSVPAKCKYLVPRTLTIGQFMYVIRKHIKLKSSQAFFLFIKETIPPVTALVGDIFEKSKDIDGFLYVVFTTENAFG